MINLFNHGNDILSSISNTIYQLRDEQIRKALSKNVTWKTEVELYEISKTRCEIRTYTFNTKCELYLDKKLICWWDNGRIDVKNDNGKITVTI